MQPVVLDMVGYIVTVIMVSTVTVTFVNLIMGGITEETAGVIKTKITTEVRIGAGMVVITVETKVETTVETRAETMATTSKLRSRTSHPRFPTNLRSSLTNSLNNQIRCLKSQTNIHRNRISTLKYQIRALRFLIKLNR